MMHTMKTIYSVIAAILLLVPHSFAQKQEYKFGSVSDEEVRMKIYESDTSAVAVVLYSGAKYTMDAKLSAIFTIRKTYFRRIKILKPEGIKYAVVSIPYKRLAKYSERVDELKISVYNIDGDSIVVYKMDKNQFLAEKNDFKNRSITFCVPDVKVGSVIDLKYNITGTMPQYYETKSDYIKSSYIDYFLTGSSMEKLKTLTDPQSKHSEGFYPTSTFSFNDFSMMNQMGFMEGSLTGDDILFPKWYFQEDIPVVKSEIEFTYFDEFKFDEVQYGLQKPEMQENDGGVYRIARKLGYSNINMSISANNLIERKPYDRRFLTDPLEEKHLKNRKFIAKNLPAIGTDCNENYVISPEKYRMAVEFDYKGKLNDYGGFSHSSNWGQVDNILFSNTNLSSKLMFTRNMYKKFTDSIKQLNTSDFLKVEAICKYLKNDIKCSSYAKGLDIISPKDAFLKKEGSDMEINALAIAALKEAGFKTNLILLKSRNRGKLQSNEISPAAMNAAIVQITLKDGSHLYFDPSVQDIGVNIINHLYITNDARVYQRENTWVDLSHIVENKEYHNAILTLSDAGMVEGKVITTATNHCCYEMAEKVQEAISDKVYFNTIKERIRGEFINGYTYNADTVNNVFKREFEFKRNSAVLVDDKILVNPFVEIYHNTEEFASEKRTFPIELKYPKTIEYTAHIIIPRGYEVEELPKNTSYSMGKGSSRATLRVSSQNEIIMLGLTIQHYDTFIPVEDYQHFRKYWQQMCSLFDEVIILKKTGSKSFSQTETIE